MIEYKLDKTIPENELKNLFLSVEWSSGQYPKRLKAALENSDTLLSAWDGDKLVGLINALSDKVMTVYFHYLLVVPEYQSRGIGRKLVEMMLDKYQEYDRKVLIAYNDKLEFYKKCGFVPHDDKTPMFITDLTT